MNRELTSDERGMLKYLIIDELYRISDAIKNCKEAEKLTKLKAKYEALKLILHKL